MRAVIQRVKQSSVIIKGKTHSQIGEGLLVLLGIEETDNDEDIIWLSNKIVNLRIFDDKDGVMNLSVKETNRDILVVSQFTLHASTKKGNRPSYIRAARPEVTIPLYEKFLLQLEKDLEKQIHAGVFQAMMEVQLINDGPVTILIDTKTRE
jgi:D-tyrosyl-tRNA(Tyr) deacylase